MALRFLKEDPWERLAALRDAVPNICLQMLIRGRNTVGYTPYPGRSGGRFCQGGGPDRRRIFRVFDALNDVDQMLPAIKGILETGKVAEGRFAIRVTWPARPNGFTRWITICVKQSSSLRRACTSYA